MQVIFQLLMTIAITTTMDIIMNKHSLIISSSCLVIFLTACNGGTQNGLKYEASPQENLSVSQPVSSP